MARFTGGKRDAPWPYGIEWLGDAYPVPHWVREQQKQEAAGVGGGGEGGGGGSGGAPEGG